MEVKFSDDSEAPENIRNECCPGQPYITFLPADSSLQLFLINPQPQKPYFQRELPVYGGDTVEKLIKRLKKTDPKLSKHDNDFTSLYLIDFINYYLGKLDIL